MLCVGVGAVGLFVPGLPSTVFFLVALWSFERSSPRLERWLLEHRLVGSTLRNWRETGSMAPRAKIVAIAMIWVCIGVSVWALPVLWVKALLLVVAVALTCYLASRPSA